MKTNIIALRGPYNEFENLVRLEQEKMCKKIHTLGRNPHRQIHTLSTDHCNQGINRIDIHILQTMYGSN